jgi:hypothetical protein
MLKILEITVHDKEKNTITFTNQSVVNDFKIENWTKPKNSNKKKNIRAYLICVIMTRQATLK